MKILYIFAIFVYVNAYLFFSVTAALGIDGKTGPVVRSSESSNSTLSLGPTLSAPGVGLNGPSGPTDAMQTDTGDDASCEDKVQNGDETDVDCGGSTCPECSDTLKCRKNSDCVSGVCNQADLTCQEIQIDTEKAVEIVLNMQSHTGLSST